YLPNVTKHDHLRPVHLDLTFFSFMTRPPPRPTLFPYTTLFRSAARRPRPACPTCARRCGAAPAAAARAGPASRAIRSGWIRCRRSEEHTSELQSLAYLVCRLLLEKKKINLDQNITPIYKLLRVI